MVDLLNSDAKLLTENGRAFFTGFTSGIDFHAAVESIIEARRFPVDRLEAKVDENTAKIGAFQDLRTQLRSFNDSLSELRGAVSIGNSKDIFESKQVFANSTREDGQTPTEAGQLLSINATNAAQVGQHSIEILQLAKAHRVASDDFASTTDALGFAGQIEINGEAVNIEDTDALVDIRDRINNANSGDNATGVSASIVSASETENILVLSADETGEEITLGDPDGVFKDLGILDADDTIKNELQAPQDAKIKVDGLIDRSAFTSDSVANAVDALSSFEGISNADGLLTLTASDGTSETVDYKTNQDSLQDLVDKINATTVATAEVVTNDDGTVQLAIDSADGKELTIDDDSTLVDELNIHHPDRIITRSTNTIDDLFEGITLDLFQAEPGTTVDFEVERGLGQIGEALVGFVDSYNALKQFINAQRQGVALEGMAEETVGALEHDRTLADVESRLNRVLARGAVGTDETARVLGQIGIDFIDNNNLEDETLRDTLVIDEDELNSALISDIDKVRDIFSFQMSADSSDVTLLNFGPETQHKEGGDFTLTLTHDGNEVTSAEIDGVPAIVNGNRIEGAPGNGAEGIVLRYTGGETTGRDINFNVTNGLASNLFFESERLLDTRGPIETEIDRLERRNTDAEERIDRKLEQLELQRERLIERFVELERALAEMERIRESLTQLTDSLGNN